MTSKMTRREEHDFYADPDNQTVHGPARRRKPKLPNPTPGLSTAEQPTKREPHE